MPLIAYLCECKNSKTKYYRQVKDVLVSVVCDKCDKQMKKCLSAPTNSSKVTVDNGFQARAIEVNPDIIEINKARSEKDYTTEE
jgi:hypothetical protein